MDEFLLVYFPEMRRLLINDIPQGWTNTIVRLEAGTYEIALAGRRNYSPDSQKVRLRYTAPTEPLELTFHPLPPSAIVPG
jgi:hypothetical protein